MPEHIIASEPIGYLVPRTDRYVAVCANDRDRQGRNTPLFREHVLPEGLRCAECGRVLVQARLGWLA